MSDEKPTHVLRLYQPDPQRNTVKIQELFHRGKDDPVIQAEMASEYAKDLMMQIATKGYQMIRVARHGRFTVIRASNGAGQFIEAQTDDPTTTICRGLEQILTTLQGRRLK